MCQGGGKQTLRNSSRSKPQAAGVVPGWFRQARTDEAAGQVLVAENQLAADEALRRCGAALIRRITAHCVRGSELDTSVAGDVSRLGVH